MKLINHDLLNTEAKTLFRNLVTQKELNIIIIGKTALFEP
jgi:hypothetical protein